MPEPDDSSDISPPPPTGRGKRFFKLGALSGKVAASYLGNTVGGLFRSKQGREEAQQRTHQKNATRLARTMSELKGAVMKVGQLLSIQDGVMPIELRDTLAQFQAQAPPMHYLFVKDIVEAELGRPIGECFARFDKKPLAAASLGQVHRAALGDGEEVVVKVQYPGIEDTIESDLANLRRVIKSMRLGGRAFDLTEAFDEIHETLTREADYLHEAEAVERFSAALRGSEKVVLPSARRELTTKRVLTLTYLDGQHLDDYVASQPDQATRDEVGTRLARTIWELEFRHGLLHADPHPGNYLFMEGERVGLLDFGCVKYLEPDFLRSYREAIKAILARDNERLMGHYLDMGFMKPEDVGTKKEEAYLAWSYLTCEPLLHDGIWEVDWEPFLKRMHDELNAMALKLGFYIPKDAVYLTRVLLGVMCFWNRLEVKINWHRLMSEVLAEPVTLSGAEA